MKILKNPKNLKGEWMTAEDLGTRLGYSSPSKSVNNLYSRNKELFEKDIDVSEIQIEKEGKKRKHRIFSFYGVMEIVRLSNVNKVPIKSIMKMFDIDKEISGEKQKKISYRFLSDELVFQKDYWKNQGYDEEEALEMANTDIKQRFGFDKEETEKKIKEYKKQLKVSSDKKLLPDKRQN